MMTLGCGLVDYDLTSSGDDAGVPESLVLRYPLWHVSYLVGREVEPLEPLTGSGYANFDATPDLPDGLAIDPASGRISGTPTALDSRETYAISAERDGELESVPLSIAVTTGWVVDAPEGDADSNPGDGICSSQQGSCTLRAALQEYVASPADDCVTIVIAGGTYSYDVGREAVLRCLNVQGSTSGTVVDLGAGEGFLQINGGITTISAITIADGDVTNLGGGADVGGAVVASDGSLLEVYDSTFRRNSARLGGAIYGATDARVSVRRSLFEDNTASDFGGAIDVTTGNSSLDVRDSSFLRNQVTGPGGGGAVNGAADTLTFTGNAVLDNSSMGPGGGLNFGRPTQTSTVVINNTFFGNTSMSSGGGVYMQDGTGAMEHNTIVGNSCSGTGCGVSNPSGVLAVRANIIAGNFRGAVLDNCESITTTLGRNLSDGDDCDLGAGDLASTDPQLSGSPELRGGLTPTFDLEATSPAIDAAQDATCPTIDQRGVARPVDYPGLGATETCDIGAVELLPQGRR